MDSVSYEPSLLVDLDGSTNPDLLTELTWTHLENPDGSVPMVAKNNTGRMSPVRARTMKEYDQQLAELKKENFSLKLRIYFLEDRMRQKFGGDDVFKTNIELKVEAESLRKELNEKQELLKKASTAIENLTTNHQAELAKRQEQIDKRKSEAQNNDLEEALRSLKEELEDKNKELDYALGKSMDLESKMNLLNQKLEKFQDNDIEHSDKLMASENQLKEKLRLVDQLNQAIQTKDEFIKELQKEQDSDSAKITELEDQVKKLSKDLARKERDLEQLACEMNQEIDVNQSVLITSHLQDELEDQKENFEILESTIKELQKQLSSKNDTIGRLEDLIKKKDKELKNREEDLDKVNKDLKSETDNGVTRDKAIQGLIAKLQDKEKEIRSMKDELAKAYDDLKETRDDLYEARMEQHKDVETEHAHIEELNNKIGDLSAEIEVKEKEMEHHSKALQQKDGELSRFKDLLKKTETALEKSEEAVESLQEQLSKEREQVHQRIEEQNLQCQNLLEDTQRQLQNKEQVIQHLTESLKDQDRLLNDCMDLNKSQHEGEENFIKNMEYRLKDKDKAIEEAVGEKYKALEQADIKMNKALHDLRDAEKDKDRANQMLLSAEETIDTLQRSNKEKDHVIKQLSTNLRSANSSMEESANNHARALQEKDGIIRRLQYSLDSKEKSLQDALKRSPSGNDAKVEKLLNRIREKDNLLEEVMLERSKAAKDNEKMYSEMMEKLKNKDKELKALVDKQNEELSGKRKEIQKLQTDVNKKDYELMTLENKACWAEEQQKSALEKLRSAVGEKDKTIEALVASAREKDRLLHQLKDSKRPSIDGGDLTMAENQKLKDKLSHLTNEIRVKNDTIEKLENMVNQSPRKESSFLAKELDNLQRELAKKSQDLAESRAREDELSRLVGDLRHQLAMKSGPVEINTLKREIIHINEKHIDSECKNDSTPKNILEKLEELLREQMAELKSLNKLLQAERQIYINLSHMYGNPNKDPHKTFEEEIAAVRALRCQLEEGIANNVQLRKELKEQSAKLYPQKPSGITAEEKSVIERLQEQLNEAEDSNQALRVELNQLRSGGDCRYYNCVDAINSPISVQRKSCGVGAERSSPFYKNAFTSPIRSQRTVCGDNDTDVSPVSRCSFGVGEGIAIPVDVTASPHHSFKSTNTTFKPLDFTYNSTCINCGCLSQGDITSSSLQQGDLTPLPNSTTHDKSQISTATLLERDTSAPSHKSSTFGSLTQGDITPSVTGTTTFGSLSQGDITPSVIGTTYYTSLQGDSSPNATGTTHDKSQISTVKLSERDISASFHISPDSHSTGQVVLGSDKTVHSSPDLINRDKDYSVSSSPSFSFTTLSLLPSSTNLASAYLSPDSTTANLKSCQLKDISLSDMSAPMLRRLVQQLQSDLLAALHEKDDIMIRLNSAENVRKIPGNNEEDGTNVQLMRKELDHLQSVLQERENENKLLLSKLGLDNRSNMSISQLPSLAEVKLENSRLKDKIQSTENINALLKRQINSNTQTDKLYKGDNPGLVIQMANEIERLRFEIEKYKSSSQNNSLSGINKKLQNSLNNENSQNLTTNALERSDSNNTGNKNHCLSNGSKSFDSLPNYRTVIGGSSKMSQIPRLKRLSTLDVTDSAMNSHKLDLVDLNARLKDMERKLAATEGTVRFQSQKIKYYKGLLMDNGLLCKGPVRSCSESNLSLLASENTTHRIPSKTLSVEDLSELASLPPMDIADPFIHFGLTNNLKELRSQVRMLKMELEGVKKDINSSIRNKLTNAATSPNLRKSPFGAESSPPRVTFGGTIEYTDHAVYQSSYSRDKTTQTENHKSERNVHLENHNNQMKILQQQLQESREANNILRQNMKVSPQPKSPSSLQSVLESQKNEISSLKKQLVDSQNLCLQLENQLEDVGGFLSDIVGQRHIDADLTSTFDDVQDKLDQSKDVLEALSLNLSLRDEEENNEKPSVASLLQDKYQKALDKIDVLKHRVSQRVSEKIRAKDQEIEYLQTQLSKLKGTETFKMELKENRKESDSGSLISSEYSRQQRISTSLESEEPANSEFKENIPPNKYGLNSGYSNVSLDSHFGHSIEKLRKRIASGSSDKVMSEKSHSFVDICDSSVPSTILSSRVNHMDTLGEVNERSSFFESVRQSGQNEQTFSDYGNLSHLNSTTYSHFHKSGTPASNKTTDFSDSVIDALSETALDNFSVSDSNSIMNLLHENTVSRSPSRELENVRAQLTIVEDLNSTLKEGMNYCDKFCSSVSVQCSPHTSFITTREKFDSNFMEEHCRQMKAWRKELGRKQAANEKLREQLEDKLNNEDTEQGTVTNILIRGRYYDVHDLEKLIERLHNELQNKSDIIHEKITIITEKEKILQEKKIYYEEADLQNTQLKTAMKQAEEALKEKDSELQDFKKFLQEKVNKIAEYESSYKNLLASLSYAEESLHEKEKLLHERNNTLQKLNELVAEKDGLVAKLTQKKDKFELMVKKAVKEIKRLRSELSSRNALLHNNQELNKTLKLELSVLEKVQQKDVERNGGDISMNKSVGDGFDISDFYAELSQLRIQFEKCVHSNDDLRQKLEEVLSKKDPPASNVTNIHYINDYSVSTSPDDIDGQDNSLPQGKSQIMTKETRTTVKKFSKHIVNEANIFGSRDTNLDGDEDSGVADNGAPKSPNMIATWPPTGQSSSDTFSGLHLSAIMPDDDVFGERSVYSKSKNRSASENNLSYRVDDPPGYNDLSFSMVDSDLRNLFAIGKLDDFELLKKQNSEGCVILSGLEARIKDRLKVFKDKEPAESIEYSTLKEISLSVENTQICLKEVARLIGCFWTSQLPPKNGHGEFYDPKALEEINYLRKELNRCQGRYQKMGKLKDRYEKRLHSYSKQNENAEKQLEKTLKVIMTARKNFEHKAKSAGYDVEQLKRHPAGVDLDSDS